MGRGETRTAVLLVLADGPMNPYQVMSELEARSGGRWRPSPGSVYPTVKALTQDGLVEVERAEDGSRRLSLTDEGRAIADARRAAGPPPWETVAEPDALEGLIDEVHLLVAAAHQVADAGTDEQVARARRSVAELRRSLYALLAEAPGGEPAGDADRHDAT